MMFAFLLALLSASCATQDEPTAAAQPTTMIGSILIVDP